MKKLQAGFIMPLLVILGALVVIGIGAGTYSYLHNTQQEQNAQKIILGYAASSSSDLQVSSIHNSTLSTSTNAVTKIDQNKVVATTTKTAPQPYLISKNDSENYVLTKNVTIDDSSYVSTKVDGYDLLKFSASSGVEVDGDGGSPSLPVYRIDIRLPIDTKIQNVKVDFGTKKYLGKLNLPIVNPLPNCMGCQTGPAYSPHPTSGLLPKVPYEYNLVNIDSVSMTLVVMIYPITYDNATEDTYVYNGFKITAEYTTKDQVIVDMPNFQNGYNNGDLFGLNQNVPITATITNMTSAPATINISTGLFTIFDKELNSTTSKKIIPGDTSQIIQAIVKTPTDTEDGQIDTYGIEMNVSNGTDKIPSRSIKITVNPSVYVEVSCFNYPKDVSYHSKILTKNDFVKFEICIKNPTAQKVRAFVNISISDDGGIGTMVRKSPQGYVDIDPGQTKSYIDQWIPSASLQSGSYGVHAEITAGNYEAPYQNGIFIYSADDASN